MEIDQYCKGPKSSSIKQHIVLHENASAELARNLPMPLFSSQTRYDFTICYGVLLILVVDLIMFGFFCTFYYSYIAEIAYGCLGALLYSLVRKVKKHKYMTHSCSHEAILPLSAGYLQQDIK